MDNFSRNIKKKSPKPRIFILYEGEVTEKIYFENFPYKNLVHKSIKKKFKKYIVKSQYFKLDKNFDKERDSFFILLDNEEYLTDELFKELKNEFKENFCLINPNFEFWLALHFIIDIKKIKNYNNDQIKRFLETKLNYNNKKFDFKKIKFEQIDLALIQIKRFENNIDVLYKDKNIKGSNIDFLIETIKDKLEIK